MEIKEKQVIREFKLSSWALRNRNTVFLMIGILLAFGIYSYRSLPKELFPDLVWPTIFVQTIYPGNPPLDMENLVTRPLEKEIESAKGVKEIRSTSTQDVSAIYVEYQPSPITLDIQIIPYLKANTKIMVPARLIKIKC